MTAPTPYPETHYRADRLFANNRWGHLTGAPVMDMDDVEVMVEASFADLFTGPAGLNNVRVWRHTDAGCSDVTEDVLRAIGARLSEDCDAEDYPPAFLAWASRVMQDAVAELQEADRMLDDRIAAKREDVA